MLQQTANKSDVGLPIIHVEKLTKVFKTYKKEPGLLASIKALVSRHYKDFYAVSNISFDINMGELVGFIGPNGAGKTTTLKMLAGLLYPTSGVCRVLGFTPHQRKHTYLRQISLIMGQKNQMWWDLPAIETFNLNKSIYDISDADYTATLTELTNLLDVADCINTPVRRLSLGQRMKCELIAALVHKPKILFLDEPTIGLDVVMQKRVREFIKTYNKKFNVTVMLTSHNMDDVKEICDRVIIINKGELIFDGDIASLIKAHANYKLLIPIFNKPVTLEALHQLDCEVIEFNMPRAVLKVARDSSSKVAADLLAKFDIDDLDINEPKLEDIVRQKFEEVLY